MGFDASSYYLKSIEMWNQKSLFIDNWQEQTTLYIDSPVPIAALLYGIINNIYIAYGISNIITLLVILVIFISILRTVEFNNLAISLSLCLILCPLINISFNNANDLGYISCMLTSAGYYSIKILICLIVIRSVLGIINKEKIKALMIICFILEFISSISSGWYILITIICPLCIYCVYRIFKTNSIYANPKILYLFIFSSIILCFIGKFISTAIIGFESKDSSLNLITIDKLWDNIGSIVLGYIELICGLNSSAQVISIIGIFSLIGLGMFISIIFLLIISMNKIKKESDSKGLILPLIIMLWNLVMFIVLDLKYGGGIFENRYLIIVYFMNIFIISHYINKISEKSIINISICILLLFLSTVFTIGGDYIYLSKTKSLEDYHSIDKIAEEFKIKNIIFLGESVRLLGRDYRVFNPNVISKAIDNYNTIYHWGDYTYYDDNLEYDKPILLISNTDDFNSMPNYFKSNCNCVFENSTFNIYYSDNYKFDFTSSIEYDESIQYPYSPGVVIQNGEILDDGSFYSDGTEGYCYFGPYISTPNGLFDIELNYNIIDQERKNDKLHATFDIALDNGTQILSKKELDTESETIILKNVRFMEGHTFETRIYTPKDLHIKIKSIKFTKLD
ncbi:MAG: hypothetical protein HFE90_11300 [Firmicutes bacterium]|nr:hypothetical protein [Bacillota bacterium]